MDFLKLVYRNTVAQIAKSGNCVIIPEVILLTLLSIFLTHAVMGS